MDKKVIEFDRKNQNFSEEKVIRFLSSFRDKVNLKLKKIENKSDNEKIVTNKFKKTINSIIELKGFNYNQMNSYAFNVSKIFRKQANDSEEDMIYKALNVAYYTCMVVDARNEIFNINLETVIKIMSALINSKLSCTRYREYLDYLFNEEIINVIENYKGPDKIENLIANTIKNIENKSAKKEVSLLKIKSELDKEINNNSNANALFHDNQYNFNDIYKKLANFMDYINNSTYVQIYNKEQFGTLKKIKKFNLLSEEEQNDFLVSFRAIDQKVIDLIDKVKQLLQLIEDYSGFINKNNNIITPDFTQSKNRRY